MDSLIGPGLVSSCILMPFPAGLWRLELATSGTEQTQDSSLEAGILLLEHQ
jgi:hypothetical protein